VAPEDPEERIAELERELAEAKREAAEYDRAAPNSDESYVQLNPGARDDISPADSHRAPLVSPTRKVPAAFRLAEVLPFRWWSSAGVNTSTAWSWPISATPARARCVTSFAYDRDRDESAIGSADCARD
jgi:hypothetical protein